MEIYQGYNGRKIKIIGAKSSTKKGLLKDKPVKPFVVILITLQP